MRKEVIERIKTYTDTVSMLANMLDAADTKEKIEEIIPVLFSYQNEGMKTILEMYKQECTTPEKIVLYNLLEYAVNGSYSGNSITHIDDESLYKKTEEILWEELGDMLLDAECYKENNSYVIDCIFGGAYIPHWEGWLE